MFDENQMDQLAEMLSARLVDRITDKVFEGVVERIAGFADDGGGDEMAPEGMDDYGDEMGGEMPPDGAGMGRMAADTGMASLPSMVGGDADPEAEDYEDDEEEGDDPDGDDDFDSYEGDDEEPDGDEDGAFDDDDGDEPEPEEDEPEDEEEERYFSGDRMIPGKKRVRNNSHCDTGKAMSKKGKYQADPEAGVVLERYNGDSELVRYQKAFAQIAASDKAKSKEIASLRRALTETNKTLERYAATLDATNRELVLRDRESELTALQSEGYSLDVDEELARTERYSHEQFDAHVELIRERYSREIPDEGHVPLGPPSRRPLPAEQESADDHRDFVRYSTSIAHELPADPLQAVEKARERYRAYKASKVS